MRASFPRLVQVRVERELRDALEDRARQADTTVSDLVRRALAVAVSVRSSSADTSRQAVSA
jgi:hypothetical protein